MPTSKSEESAAAIVEALQQQLRLAKELAGLAKMNGFRPADFLRMFDQAEMKSFLSCQAQLLKLLDEQAQKLGRMKLAAMQRRIGDV